MSNKAVFVRKRRSDSARAKTQQRHRRKKGLFKKAAEFSLECESDVFLAVRINKTGQIYTLDSSFRKELLDTLSNLVRLVDFSTSITGLTSLGNILSSAHRGKIRRHYISSRESSVIGSVVRLRMERKTVAWPVSSTPILWIT